MKLGAVLSSINTFLADKVPGVELHIGAEWVAKAKSPPAVVWVPGRERFERPTESHRAKPNEQARSLGTNIATVFARCWAKRSGAGPASHEYDDLDAARELAELVINGARRAAFGAFSVVAAEHPDQDGGQLSQLGRLYVVQFEFRLPVVEYTADKYTPVKVVPSSPVLGSETVITTDTDIQS